jgi:hypothetical protein
VCTNSPIGYLQVNRINLCKNVIRAIDANKDDIPPITAYPISAQVSTTYVPKDLLMLPCKVTYRYYMGVLAFLQEDYKKVRNPAHCREYRLILPQAEIELTFAFENCHHGAPRNQE